MESSNSRLSADLAAIVAAGNYRDSLEAMRDRLAAEADETTWDKHKRECVCVCGMGDGRTLVAVLKQLDVVLAKLDALPDSKKESRSDDLAARREARRAAAANQ